MIGTKYVIIFAILAIGFGFAFVANKKSTLTIESDLTTIESDERDTKSIPAFEKSKSN